MRLPCNGGPRFARGLVDQGVTAASTAVLNIEENGLLIDWQVALQFRNAEREFFSLQVPPEYLVTKVDGDNVRGWEVRDADQHRELAVSLLNPAKDSEQFTIHLWREGAVGQGDLAEFETPMVRVEGAALHRGQLVIRRSPLLDVRTVSASGVTRCDLPDKIELGGDGAALSPLGIRPLAAYTFAAMPCSVRLSASAVGSRMTAYVQALLRIGEREHSLEAKFNLTVRDRQRHHFSLLLPGGLDVQEVSVPGTFEWALTRTDDGQLLSIDLAGGRTGDVPVVVRGELDRSAADEGVSLPEFKVLDVESQQGDIVVQVDPSFEVRATDLHNCKNVLLERVHHWLSGGQRQLARLALHYWAPDYAGVLHLSAKRPAVTCETVTNVRVTDRALEETILLNFSIQHAGIRELSFLLPDRLKDARISVPLLREKIIEPGPAGPEPMVRVRLVLQDAVMDEFRVLVEDDRLLTREAHSAPIPMVETGRTDQRYVVLESAGRDEVVIEQREGLDVLTRQQKEWRALTGILGTGLTNAYVVSSGAQQPALSFAVKERKTVETVGARIGLAETRLVLDANGAYRAAQVFRIHNMTEQVLEVELPAGASLWTVQVAGDPVKPADVPDRAKTNHVRIPLVKTAAGELDYTVMLKYGGRLPALERLSSIELPLVRSVNINAEQSQVRLFVPEGYHWFDFDGTMRLVDSEQDLAAGYVTYQTEQAKRLSRTMQSADSFAKLRAASSLKRLKGDVDTYRGKATFYNYGANEELEKAWTSNAMILQSAEQQVEDLEKSIEQQATPDNRAGLNLHFQSQRAAREGDAFKQIGRNFDAAPEPGVGGAADDSGQFDGQWFADNGLGVVGEPEQRDKLERLAGEVTDSKLLGKRGTYGLDGRDSSTPRKGKALAKPSAPQVAQTEMLGEVQQDAHAQRQSGSVQAQQRAQQRRRGGRQETVERYQQALEQQAEQVSANEVGPQSGSVTYDDKARVRMLEGASAGEAVRLLTGLTSLDVEFPTRGKVYFFTAPRGEVEIRARAVSRPLLANLGLVGLVILIVGAIAGIWRFGRRGRLIEQNVRAITTIMILVGLAGVVIGLLPVLGVVLAVVGIVWKVQVARQGSATTA